MVLDVDDIQLLRSWPKYFTLAKIRYLQKLPEAVLRQKIAIFESLTLLDTGDSESDSWINRLLVPKVDVADQIQCLGLKFPESIVIGRYPIYEAGWTVQLPWLTALAVRESATTLPAVENIRLFRRPSQWFEVVRPVSEDGRYGLQLPPEVALLDVLAHDTEIQILPRDLDPDEPCNLDLFDRFAGIFGIPEEVSKPYRDKLNNIQYQHLETIQIKGRKRRWENLGN